MLKDLRNGWKIIPTRCQLSERPNKKGASKWCVEHIFPRDLIYSAAMSREGSPAISASCRSWCARQREIPNSFSMSAIIGCVKPALRNAAKS
jgi:hypothetical protein